MTRALSDIEAEIPRLNRPEQERLVQTLLKALDGPPDADAEQMWLDEVQRRSSELDAGLVTPIPAEVVFERVRARLKQ